MKRRVCSSYSFLLPTISFLLALSVLSCASRPPPAPGALPEPSGGIPVEPALPEFAPEEAAPIPSIEYAGLLLAFDDDFADVWEQYFDLLDQYGARVTFFIQGGYSPFCVVAEDRGHEIGYHTKNHYNLLRVSRQVFFDETIGGAEALRRHGLSLRSFAYPYGYSEPWMDEALGETFSLLRGFGASMRIYNVDTIRSGVISSKSIDNILYKNDAEFEADITAMLAAIKTDGGILPLTTHTIAADADWGIRPDRLEYLLKTAAELGLQFYRYGDFF